MILALVFLGLGRNGQVAGALRPGELKAAYVLRRDIGERRIAPSGERSAIVTPVTIGLAGARRRDCRRPYRALRFHPLTVEDDAANADRQQYRGGGGHRMRG